MTKPRRLRITWEIAMTGPRQLRAMIGPRWLRAMIGHRQLRAMTGPHQLRAMTGPRRLSNHAVERCDAPWSDVRADLSPEERVSVERILVLDKLPEGTTDSKLAELIPEAIEIIDFGLFEESQG